MDNIFNQSSGVTDTKGEIANVTSVHFAISPSQGKISNVTSEGRISPDILEETINGFNKLLIQSTIIYFLYDNSEKDDAESDPNSVPKVATYTTNRNYPHKILTN